MTNEEIIKLIEGVRDGREVVYVLGGQVIKAPHELTVADLLDCEYRLKPKTVRVFVYQDANGGHFVRLEDQVNTSYWRKVGEGEIEVSELLDDHYTITQEPERWYLYQRTQGYYLGTLKTTTSLATLVIHADGRVEVEQ